ncbi:MAG: rhomboid family intramembrane serine protease [Robiginitomaculum sp.]|nr:rhomboid family intramembrane serine protease [Robiginitomaculum sp.]MDQ7076803.1 rhomboid family intramembrane serine protease [Robiginitomaculum sp.]
MTQLPKEPVFGEIPQIILGLCGVIIAISAFVLLAPIPLSNWIMGVMAVQIGPEQLPRPFGPYPAFALHVFVHGGWLHLGMNILGLLAFGSPIARWLESSFGTRNGALAFLLIFFLTAVAGALTEGAVIALGNAPGAVLVGASGGLMGLIGVLVRLNYGREYIPLPLFSRTVLMAALPWVGLNVLIAFFGMPGVSAAVAWPAHLGGLFAGMVLAGPFAPRR